MVGRHHRFCTNIETLLRGKMSALVGKKSGPVTTMSAGQIFTIFFDTQPIAPRKEWPANAETCYGNVDFLRQLSYYHDYTCLLSRNSRWLKYETLRNHIYIIIYSDISAIRRLGAK